MTDGWRRQVTELNNNGTVAVSIPKEAAEEHGIINGDEVVITEANEDADETLQLHFKDE